MGKCSVLIKMGKNNGKQCGIYTGKKIDNKFVCAGHYKAIIEKERNNKLEQKKINPNLTLDFENASVDDIIEHECNKLSEIHKSNTDINLAKFNHLFDKVNKLEKICEKFDEKKKVDVSKYNNDSEDEFEIFK